MEKYQEKFIKEARLIARFDHPNVIRIHDVFAENNTAYYVMDFIEGSSLNDIVKMNGPMAEPEALRLIKAVGDGLSYVHAQGVNHLDVKPGNIMVRDSDGKPVLIDFGMSKQYDEGGEQTSSTPIGISEGYAPLEQYNMGGVSTFSPQTDIYSLAATLYRLVTGQVPPKASEVMNEGLPEMPETVSQGTRDAIEKAMQFRKKDRPAGVPEFLAMLSFSGQPNFDASVPASVACLDDSSTTLLVEEPSVPSVFTLELKSAPSRIMALSALSELGFSEDEAFDILLKLPYVLYETSDQDLISRAERLLTDAGCDVSVSACESSANIVYHVTVLSLQSRMKALTIMTELGFSEDDAFEKLASLPCELVFDSKDEADRVEALLSDAGCDVQVSYSEAPSEQFSLIIESVSSKIKALSALGSIGFSDDEAFELLSSLR